MGAPVCRVCGSVHWQRDAHIFKADGPNRDNGPKVDVGLAEVDVSLDGLKDGDKRLPEGVATNTPLAGQTISTSTKNKQRWNREKYNAYMRAYRAKRKAEALNG